jgi:hypothetical protein
MDWPAFNARKMGSSKYPIPPVRTQQKIPVIKIVMDDASVFFS